MQSLATIERITDPERRLKAVSRLIEEASAKADEGRTERALALLVLAEPFHRARRPLDSALRILDEQRDAGEITAEEYEAAEERERAAYRQRLKDYQVEWMPADCYNLVGVSRQLFARMARRAPAALPKMDHPDKVAKRAHSVVVKYDEIVEAARPVRDDLALAMLTGTVRRPDGSTYRNADVARLSGLTSQRMVQLQQGTR